MKKRDPRSTSPGPGNASALPVDVRVTRLAADVLLVLGAGALLAMAVLALVHHPRFNFQALSLEGDLQHNSVPVIRTQVLPQLSGNYFSLNLREARHAFEAVPWVRRATVRRVWPNRLVVTLEQHRASAFWERAEHGERDDGNPHLVNQQGEVFEVNLGDVEDEPLPVLRGPDGSSVQVWQMYQRLTPVFAQMGEPMRHLKLSMRGSWQATLDSGARIELGRGNDDEVVQRTQRFAATVAQVTARYSRDTAREEGRQEGHGIEYADLRHEDAYALRLRGVGTQRDPNGPVTASARQNRR